MYSATLVRPSLYDPTSRLRFAGGGKTETEKTEREGDIFERSAQTTLNGHATQASSLSLVSQTRTQPSAPHKVAILGGGNSGYAALAGILQSYGASSNPAVQPTLIIPRKSERGLAHLASIEKNGGIRVEDTLQKETYHVPVGREQIVGGWDTAKTQEILQNSQTVFITVPDIPAARKSMMKALLKSDLAGKTVILLPGGEGGVLEAARLLSKRKGEGVTVGMLETAPFGARMSADGLQAKWKGLVKVGVFPARNTPQVIETLERIFPMTRRTTGERVIRFKPVHPAEIILSGQNYIYHVAVVLDAKNLRRSIHTVQPPLPGEKGVPVQEKLDYNHYLEGVTPRIAEIMERLDEERLAIGQALGLKLEPLNEALNNHYNIGRHPRYYDAFQACRNVYHSRVPAAKDLAHHRYVVEDLPGVSVIERLGAIAKVPTPATSELKETATWNALAIGTEPHEIKGYHKALKRLPDTVKELMTYFEDPAAWSERTRDSEPKLTRPSFLKELTLPAKSKL